MTEHSKTGRASNTATLRGDEDTIRKVDRAIDPDYLRYVVTELSAIGPSELGFRVAGTPEDERAARFVADELRKFGLQDTGLEPVPVDSWRFRGGTLDVGGRSIGCASLGGSLGTPPGGVEADLVFVGRGSRRDLAGLDIRGNFALVEWDGNDQLFWPSLRAAEAQLAGARAIVCSPSSTSRYHQAPGGLGTFDGLSIAGGIPIATITGEDGRWLRAALEDGEALTARLTLQIELKKGATGYNSIGRLPGRGSGGPIVVGAHHDGWFHGAFDNATGVAATLAIAKAFCDAGFRPERSIVFTTHTAEEYGLADSAFDWLIGSWWQVKETHPEWRSTVPFYVSIEATGHTELLQIDTPPELKEFCSGICESLERAGLVPAGFRFGMPRTGTELWPVVAAGIPAIDVQSVDGEFLRQQYHTQLDTIELINFETVARLTRCFARFIIGADSAPETLLEPGARARDFRERGLDSVRSLGIDTTEVESALGDFERSTKVAVDGRSREAFAVLATELEGLRAGRGHFAMEGYLHEQALQDLAAIRAATRAFDSGDIDGTIEAASECGRNALALDVSKATFALDEERHRSDHPGAAWAAGHLTQSPNLWDELASLTGDPTARGVGSWVRDSLAQAEEQAANTLRRQLAQAAEAFRAAARVLEGSDG